MPNTEDSKGSTAGDVASMLSGVRDTVRLKLHLLSADARDRWSELESRLDNLQRALEPNGEEGGSGVSSKLRDMGQAAENLLHELHVPSELQQPADRLMSRARSCEPKATLDEAARIMWEADCGVVPVTEGERLVGVITDRDICMTAHLRGLPLSQLSVGSAMSPDVKSCSPSDSLQDVLRIMRSERVRRVPIVDDGRLVGIISLGDISRHVQAQAKWNSAAVVRVERVLAAISMPRKEGQSTEAGPPTK